MPDTALIIAVMGVILTAICAIAAWKSFSLQKQNTPKLPEPAITPLCTTILGVDMNGHVGDLPGYSRMRSSNHKMDGKV